MVLIIIIIRFYTLMVLSTRGSPGRYKSCFKIIPGRVSRSIDNRIPMQTDGGITPAIDQQTLKPLNRRLFIIMPRATCADNMT